MFLSDYTLYWELPDGRIWSSASAGFVPSVPDGRNTIPLPDEDVLARILDRLLPDQRTQFRIEARDIRAEAERRIDAGTTINGLPFRTDDATMTRLRGLMDAFQFGDVPPGGVSYATAAGDVIVFTDLAAVQAVYRTANLYRSAVLEASRVLQSSLPADYADDRNWPVA